MIEKKRRKKVRRRPVRGTRRTSAASGVRRSRDSRIAGALIVVLLAVVLAIITLWHVAPWDWRKAVSAPEPAAADAGAPEQLSYTGSDTCRQCHAREFELWQGSDHQQAMQHANAASVLGNFDNAQFRYGDITSTFFRRDGKFFVNTDGPDGKLADFEIKYTFGVRPLQQYLIEFADGRLQPLSIAWDSRPREQGGQRWYHLYPDQHIDYRNPLHWTRLSQNWNFMCAECHTTNLKRGYDPAQNRFQTTWSEINVSCESCHGPGSEHVERARKSALGGGSGLAVKIPSRAAWLMDAATGNSHRATPRSEHTELEICAPCHARRAQFREGQMPGQPLLDTHLPALLTENLYHADGQMQDEVFNYGSFLQSKMYAQGVSCGDCHEPHSLKLRAPGNGVCLQCHAAPKYDVPDHHHHVAGSQGAQCASCHMPVHTYMGVDRRHDHSFRVPRPDQAVQFGTPNACNDCHDKRSAQWAAQAVEKWFGPERKGLQRFAPALDAARKQLPEAPALLRRVIDDHSQPGIARATAYAELGGYLTPSLAAELRRGLRDADPLVRLGALQGLADLPPEQRWDVAADLLRDPLRGLRIEAASFLAPVPADSLTAPQRALLQEAIDEYIAAQRGNADRPEAHMNLGALYAQRGDARAAEREYRSALKLDPGFVQATINLADLYRDLGRDAEGEQLLRGALRDAPATAAAHHALGLLLVRAQRLPEALAELAAAARLEPAQARYAYVYAIAQHSSGQAPTALATLEDNHRRHPSDRATLLALVSLNREAGHAGAALQYARKLAVLTPDDMQLQQWIQGMERAPH